MPNYYNEEANGMTNAQLNALLETIAKRIENERRNHLVETLKAKKLVFKVFLNKFTISYTINQPVPVGSGLITRTAIVYGKTVEDGKEKVRKLDDDFLCFDNIISEELLTEGDNDNA